MKRDLDLIRTLLKAAEVRETGPNGPLIAEGYTEKEIMYHCYLMHDAGLVEGFDCTTASDLIPQWGINYLTWAGHDFLDAIKDDTLWAKAKKNVIQPAGGVAFNVLVEWAKQEAKNRLGLS